MNQTTDRIEKRVLLRAPLERVWRAVSDAQQFGAWFGVEFDRPFVAGTHLKGRITPTKVDAEIAKAQEPHAGKLFEWSVEQVEPMRLISFRWHPFAVEPNVDYSNEPTTLVTLELHEEGDGTRLTISESGFERIPLERRLKAFAANEQGWEAQSQLIAKYLAGAASAG